MKKRIIGLLLVVVMLFAAVPAAYADNEDQLPFDDVKSGQWFYEPIAFVTDKGLMTGVSESSFAPNADLTRAVFVTALSHLDGNDTQADAASDFSDVSAGEWHSAHIAWAVGNGVIEGYSDGRFGPDDPVSREQMAAIIARYLDTLGIAPSEAPGAVEGFKDAAEVSDYALEGLELMRISGVIQGDERGNFNPQSGATRAEASAVFMRLDAALRSALPKPGVSTAITNVRIFDGIKMSELTTVVIEDGVITDKTEGDIVIDGKGGFLMPGLIDAHAHLYDIADMERSVKYGVTATFSLSAPDEIRGLRGLTRIWSSYAYALGSVEDADAFVANEVANGSDFIKVIIEDPAMMAPKTISREVLEGIVEAAHREGLLVTAHAVAVPTFQMAVDAGVDIMIHVPLEAVLPQETVQQMVKQGTAVVPTLVMMEAFANSPVYGYNSEDYKNAEDNVRLFIEAGVPVMAGTDSSNADYVPKISFGLDMHRELSLLVKAGMTPLEALNSASALTAEVFGFGSIGAIEAGRHADLVLIDGDPGKDIGDISKIQKVWIGGVEVA